jgi:hypothetical protein
MPELQFFLSQTTIITPDASSLHNSPIQAVLPFTTSYPGNIALPYSLIRAILLFPFSLSGQYCSSPFPFSGQYCPSLFLIRALLLSTIPLSEQYCSSPVPYLGNITLIIPLSGHYGSSVYLIYPGTIALYHSIYCLSHYSSTRALLLFITPSIAVLVIRLSGLYYRPSSLSSLSRQYCLFFKIPYLGPFHYSNHYSPIRVLSPFFLFSYPVVMIPHCCSLSFPGITTLRRGHCCLFFNVIPLPLDYICFHVASRSCVALVVLSMYVSIAFFLFLTLLL